VALYARSLQGRDFGYLNHPRLFDYARAVMADPRTREYLREDPGLRAEFPAKPLAGLDEQHRWRPLPNRASQSFEALLVSNRPANSSRPRSPRDFWFPEYFPVT
jgi:hypothetical protein